ncbi:MAG: hypothetical protein JNM19_06525 [Chitinophagaceae bacterium]|nr:hypothetical protein [Chitinophagaceae bacterium]
MKKIFFPLLMIIACQMTTAQNVGIGTTTPNVDALLDISSTSKGVLFPRMTTLQRISINTPPNGLMVFDTDRNELYQYVSAAFSWQALINDSYWRRQSLTRSRIGNSSDSVGMGTLSPTERLDVNGNIRSRDNIIADGVITGGGLSTPGGLTVSSNGLIGGNLTVNADLSTNSGLTINNPAATLQLKNGSNVNKAFFQLSGDDVRMGTNSGNTTGNLIVRMNGNNRVTINSSGDIDLDGKITKQSATGSNNLVPYCYGRINANGSIQNGTGNFTVQKTGTGLYEITCVGVSFNTTVVFVTSPTSFINVSGRTVDLVPDYIEVITNDRLTNDRTDASFYFIAYKL